MFTLNDTRINIYAKFTDPATGEYGIDLTTPANRDRFGIVEVADPAAPEDYSDKLYYRTEQDTAPFVVYTRKSDEQIRASQLADMPSLSPRQIRQALSRSGLRSAVEAAVRTGDQDMQDWWEFATLFERTHPLVIAMGTAMEQTDAQMDALWALGASL